MIDKAAACLALRARAQSVVVATTGAIDLTATATGYTRSDGGSFLTDKFAPGMEVTPSGFGANTVGTITLVTASAISVRKARTAEGSAPNRSLRVLFPSIAVYENERVSRGEAGQPYVVEEFVPGEPVSLVSVVSGGTATETGLYVLKLYGGENYGMLGLRTVAAAIETLFAPGTTIAVGSDVLRITSVQSGQLLRDGEWSVIPIRAAWWALTNNAVAA